MPLFFVNHAIICVKKAAEMARDGEHTYSVRVYGAKRVRANVFKIIIHVKLIHGCDATDPADHSRIQLKPIAFSAERQGQCCKTSHMFLFCRHTCRRLSDSLEGLHSLLRDTPRVGRVEAVGLRGITRKAFGEVPVAKEWEESAKRVSVGFFFFNRAAGSTERE